jgi:hypothetical protein
MTSILHREMMLDANAKRQIGSARSAAQPPLSVVRDKLAQPSGLFGGVGRPVLLACFFSARIARLALALAAVSRSPRRSMARNGSTALGSPCLSSPIAAPSRT